MFSVYANMCDYLIFKQMDQTLTLRNIFNRVTLDITAMGMCLTINAVLPFCLAGYFFPLFLIHKIRESLMIAPIKYGTGLDYENRIQYCISQDCIRPV